MANSGVRHEVARVFVRDDPVFCHRYRTGTCVEGNLGVRSSRDNVASARLSRQRNREGTLRLPASQGGRELVGWIFSPPRKFLESCRGLVE